MQRLGKNEEFVDVGHDALEKHRHPRLSRSVTGGGLSHVPSGRMQGLTALHFRRTGSAGRRSGFPILGLEAKAGRLFSGDSPFLVEGKGYRLFECQSNSEGSLPLRFWKPTREKDSVMTTPSLWRGEGVIRSLDVTQGLRNTLKRLFGDSRWSLAHFAASVELGISRGPLQRELLMPR